MKIQDMTALTTDTLKTLRQIAAEQRRACLPLDKTGWDKTYNAATVELEKRGIICHPYPKKSYT